MTQTPNGHARRDDVGGVVTVTFTRDDKLNAISEEMFAALWEAVRDLQQRDDLRVLLIRAEGRYFTAGIDLADSARAFGGDVSGMALRKVYRDLHLLFDEFEALEKPVVQAVQGPCLGVGVEFGASCDFRLASEDASFALPEIPKLAVIPGSGGISRLTRLVGPHWARWIALAGETVDAGRALTMGFVHEVWPAVEFAGRVEDFAARLAALPAEAVGLGKLAIDAAAATDRTTARDIDRIANTILLSSDDHRDRINAFLRKR